MIYFFVPEIFKFSYYANFATDDVIGCTSTVVWHKLRISPPIRKQCYWNLLLINSIHSNVKNSKKDWGTFNALCSERNVKKLIILYPIAQIRPVCPPNFVLFCILKCFCEYAHRPRAFLRFSVIVYRYTKTVGEQIVVMKGVQWLFPHCKVTQGLDHFSRGLRYRVVLPGKIEWPYLWPKSAIFPTLTKNLKHNLCPAYP